MNRDPKINPQPGDVLLGNGGVRLVSTKPEKVALVGLIWYKTATHNECNAYPDTWIEWSKTATVLHIA